MRVSVKGQPYVITVRVNCVCVCLHFLNTYLCRISVTAADFLSPVFLMRTKTFSPQRVTLVSETVLKLKLPSECEL